MECSLHGPSELAFACSHLLTGTGLGFYHSGPPDEDQSRPDAWCSACEERRRRVGGWTDESEADIILVCSNCWDIARERNLTERGDC